jgi:hypothetical protein
MDQNFISEIPVNEQPIEKKAIWETPEFTILSPGIIKGSGDAGPDINAQFGS